jgi:hypothetical protein
MAGKALRGNERADQRAMRFDWRSGGCTAAADAGCSVAVA